MTIHPYAKAAVAFLISVIGGATAAGLIAGPAAAWCAVVIGALTTSGVYIARNAPATDRESGRSEVLVVAVLLLAAVALVIYIANSLGGPHA